MKISLVITEGAKQIMMTPETEHERAALRMIAPGDTLRTVSQWGSFGDERKHVSYQVGKCEGGYYRAFETRDSLMLVITENVEDVLVLTKSASERIKEML